MAIGRLNIGLTGVQPGGLAKIIPTSVAVGSGSGSVDSNGNVTFSGASSVSLSNFVTSTYANYKIVSLIAGSTNLVCQFKFRENTTDKSTNYYGAGWYYRFNSTSGIDAARNNGTEAVIGATKSGGICVSEFLYTVQSSGADGIIVGQAYDDNSTGGLSFTYKCGATAITGASIIASTGTMTGSVRIYGYN